MPQFSFTVTEHDPERPWIMVGRERQSATFDDARGFYRWAKERWPAPRCTVELDPWQLSPTLRR